MNGLVANGKFCCRGFVLELFQSTTSYKIDSEHTRDYTKLFLVRKCDTQVTVIKIEVLSSLRMISDDFRLKKCLK